MDTSDDVASCTFTATQAPGSIGVEFCCRDDEHSGGAAIVVGVELFKQRSCLRLRIGCTHEQRRCRCGSLLLKVVAQRSPFESVIVWHL